MLVQQLYDLASSTYTYLLADKESDEALLIDPVFENLQRDMALLRELGLTLKLVIETHAHADHITSAWLLKQKTGCKIASARVINAEHADLLLDDGDQIGVTGISLTALSTPGHTNGCMCFLPENKSCVFTGDTLLIRGCGRSDFQEGSAHTLFQSITSILFSLPDDCIVYPGHDYIGRLQSTIGEEKQFNARAGGGANERDFVEYMHAMVLPHPKRLEEAVPANLRSGCPEDGKLPHESDWSEARYTYAGVPEVDRNWLEQHMADITLLDVRQLDELEAESELACELHIPLAELSDRVGEVPSGKPVVAFCRSGRRSALAVKILREGDHVRCASLKGGLLSI